MKQFWSSLRCRLILLVLLATLPAFALILYSGFQARSQAEREAQSRTLSLAHVASMEHQQMIQETQRLLTSLAQIPAVRNADPSCPALLAGLLKQYQIYTNLAVINPSPEGELLCSATPIPPGTPATEGDRKFFQRALQTKQFSYAEYVVGRISGKATLLTGLPVLDASGNVVVVLHAGIDLTWLNEFGAQVQLPPGSLVAVVDRTGQLLIRFPEPEKWVGKNLADSGLVTSRVVRGEREGSGQGVGAEGVDRIYGFTAMGGANNPDDDVFVSVAMPTATASADANNELKENLIGLAVVAALALIAAWFGSDLFLLRRVQALVAASRRVAAGDLQARSGIEGDEGQLGRAFDEMASSLQQRSADRRRAEAERNQLIEELEREKATLAGMLTSMSQGVIMVEGDGRVSYCSARASSLLDVEPKAVVGSHVDDLLNGLRATAKLGSDALPDWQHIRLMLAGSPSFELSMPGIPPRDLTFDVYLVPMEGADPAYGILVRDVTAERTAARTKDSVIATVSHELRTPLSSIRSYSEMLLEYDDASVRREFLEIINTESERLTRLLNEVLDLATIESGKVAWNVSTFDLAPLIEDSIRVYTPLAREHELSITARLEPGLPPVSTDADRLRQVLNNLLDNAIKFTDSGGITVGARVVGDEIWMSVEDSGVGIPAEDLERIFDRFHQGGTVSTGKPRGIGLGLSICREIVRRCGGRLWAESVPGQGSTFVVALPAQRAQSGAPEAAELASVNS